MTEHLSLSLVTQNNNVVPIMQMNYLCIITLYSGILIPWDAIANYRKRGGNRNFFSHSAGDQKSGRKVSASLLQMSKEKLSLPCF